MFKVFYNTKDENLVVPMTSQNVAIKEFVSNTKQESTDKTQTYSYDYVVSGGHLHKRLKTFNKNRTKMQYDRINSKGFGKIHIRVGNRPQSYFKNCESSVNFYNRNKDVFKHYEVDVDSNLVVNGNYDTNKHTLEATACPVDVNGDPFPLPVYDDFLSCKKIIMAIVRKLKINVISSPKFEDNLMSHFNADSQPGFSQFLINKHKTKRTAYKTSVVAAKNICGKLDKIAYDSKMGELVYSFIKNKPVASNMYTIGARNKRESNYDDLELATSRAVHMPEFNNEISTCAWIDGISDSIKNSKNNPIYIGNSITRFERFEKDIDSSVHCIEGDWRKYDSTIKLLGLLIATCISRLYYPMHCKRATVYFYWVFYLHSVKNYYLPGGSVIRIYNGLPSGTKCTTIWNSFYNLFALLYCCNNLNYRKLSFAVGGDDFVILSKEEVLSEQIDIIKTKADDLGMEFKFLKNKVKNSSTISDLPYFYKYSVRNGVPVVSPATLMERIFSPFNINIKSNSEFLSFLNDLLPNLGYPSSTHIIYYSIYAYVYNCIYKNVNNRMTIGRVFKLHKESYYSFRYSYKKRSSIDSSYSFFNGIHNRFVYLNTFEIQCVSNLLLNGDFCNVKTYSSI